MKIAPKLGTPKEIVLKRTWRDAYSYTSSSSNFTLGESIDIDKSRADLYIFS